MHKSCFLCPQVARYRLTAKAGRQPDGETGYSMHLYACRDHFDEAYGRLEQEFRPLDPRIFVDRVDQD